MGVLRILTGRRDDCALDEGGERTSREDGSNAGWGLAATGRVHKVRLVHDKSDGRDPADPFLTR
jgi:hypothetical protein